MDFVKKARDAVVRSQFAPEPETVVALISALRLNSTSRALINAEAIEMARRVRQVQPAGLMSPFLVEYGLSTDEGIALMCLAEALLRVPDANTVDALISDKLTAADWGRHLGHSSSSLVNASTWALLLTGKILRRSESDDVAFAMRRVLQRLGEPVVRVAVAKAIELIADQFIRGADIASAVARGRERVEQGYRYSYDMLGESALTWADARRYTDAYASAIKYLAQFCYSDDIRDNPGISVKLSAIHPRYEATHRSLILDELASSILQLAILAKESNMGFNIDAEEADKLELSLDVIASVLPSPSLDGWDGFGIVVQAYGQRALPTIEWVYSLASHYKRKVMLRLVKGAYWDTEIKRAQVLGLSTYPVFTRKSSTDLSYLACAQRLFELNDRIYPQFATHNIHTIRSVLELANQLSDFEFQRLHGMGEEVHEVARDRFNYRCRIYAPVGAHRDLLAYLVRRVLENGANSSFVNQLMDRRVAVEQIVSDPIEQTQSHKDAIANLAVPQPRWIYGRRRENSVGTDLASESEYLQFLSSMQKYFDHTWVAKPSKRVETEQEQTGHQFSPAQLNRLVGQVHYSDPNSISNLVTDLKNHFDTWQNSSGTFRATALERLADLYEEHRTELAVLMIRETGKTIMDALAEVREAVDFCRYYANEAARLDQLPYPNTARGVMVCISPWNFPLAIFTGQIVAALAAGNPVIAKPAEQACLVASKAMHLMHCAEIPATACAIVYGEGETVGSALVSNPHISGVNFTGSTETARLIHRSMAKQGNPLAKLVAETGGLNAMIVDSTALPEQTVRDIIVSAFQSAGQRCSALRMLYVQNEMKPRICEMLFGAMELLVVGDPWDIETDIGPVIDAQAKANIDAYVNRMKAKGLLRCQTPVPEHLYGHFVGPCVFEVSGIEDLEGEIFGPVLHIASFRSQDLSAIIDSINRSGYGLTFGIHSRIDSKIQQVTDAISAGNIYVNRNQIGAVVGCQPFGGVGLSGTGPKAGGPHYVPNLRHFFPESDSIISDETLHRGNLCDELDRLSHLQVNWAMCDSRAEILKEAVKDDEYLCPILEDTIKFLKSPIDLDGPTGESNRLYIQSRGLFICIGSRAQVIQALACGNAVLAVGMKVQTIESLIAAQAPIVSRDLIPDAKSLASCDSIAGIAFEQCEIQLARTLRNDLAGCKGPIVQLITDHWAPWHYVTEKTLCIDTTAAGGNAQLLIESGS